ncbi:lipase family protein [Herbihabitans rhizosphaerae]|nr:lipase family protein [Herbihabitans rhizosphaerae]
MAGHAASAPRAAAPAQKAQSLDEFYVPPNPLPQGAPGDIIRARPSKAGPRAATVNAWQVMYLSTNAHGQPNAVTGTVLVPKNVDPATAPVIGMGPGTHGPAAHCVVSSMINVGAYYEQNALNDMFAKGYAVAVTDYEGYHPTPKTTYMNGKSMGNAVVNVVRAAQRLPEAKLSKDAKVMFRGYSQGGAAATWAGQIQPEVAPELKLVGVVGGGVPADLVQVALPLDGKFGSGLLFYALLGLNNAYSELKLENYLNEAGKAAFADMSANSCALELLSKYRDKRANDYMTSSPILTPEWLARIGESKLVGKASAVPIYQYHSTGDDLVDFSQGKTLRDEQCAAGVKLTWHELPTDHITGVYTGNPGALEFMVDRLADKPATSNC